LSEHLASPVVDRSLCFWSGRSFRTHSDKYYHWLSAYPRTYKVRHCAR